MDLSSFLRRGLKIRHLHVLVMLDEVLSVSRAAERLHISQGAVSRTLCELEAGFGFAIFDRHPRGLLRTAHGQQLLRAVRAIIDDIAALETLAGQFTGLSRGEVRIGVQASSLFTQITAMVVDFKQNYPNVDIRLHEGIRSRLIDDLQHNRLDLVYARIGGDLAERGLVSHAMSSGEIAIIAGRQTAPPPEDLGALMQRPWILPTPGTPMRDEFDALLARTGHMTPPDCITVDNTQLIFGLVSTSNRLSLCPAPLAEAWHLSYGLQRFATPPGMSNDPLGVIYVDRKSHAPAVEAYLKKQIAAEGADVDGVS